MSDNSEGVCLWWCCAGWRAGLLSRSGCCRHCGASLADERPSLPGHWTDEMASNSPP